MSSQRRPDARRVHQVQHDGVRAFGLGVEDERGHDAVLGGHLDLAFDHGAESVSRTIDRRRAPVGVRSATRDRWQHRDLVGVGHRVVGTGRFAAHPDLRRSSSTRPNAAS